MSKHIKATNHVSENDAARSCSIGLGILQIIVGVLLVTASAYGYTLLHHPAALIPALAGAVLLFHGARAFQVCREQSEFHDHHPSNGMTG